MPRIFVREPTTILAVVQAALALLVTFQFDQLTDTQAALITGLIAAVLAVANALAVRPVAPAAFVQLIGAAAALVAAYGFVVRPETVGAIQALIVTVVALQARGQVTPVADPRPVEHVVG
jgi:drug/metabolite transporter (DMT)-like permease